MPKVPCLFCSNRFYRAQAPRRLITNDPAQWVPDEAVKAFLALPKETPAPRMGKIIESPGPWRFWARKDIQGADGVDLRKICPRCHMELPQSVSNSEGTSRTIVLLGPRDSGKSNYLGVLIHALEHRFKDEVGFEEFRPLETFNVQEAGKGIMSSRLWSKRYNEALNLGEEGMGHRPVDQTSSVNGNPNARIPLLYRVQFRNRRHFDLALFDTAGEDLGTGVPIDQSYFYPHIAEAAGLIFLINPADLPTLQGLRRRPAAGGISPNREARGTSDAVLDDVLQIFARRGIHRRVPAAFVVTMLDRFSEQIYRGSPIHDEGRHHGGFDAQTSRLISEEMVAYLRHWGAGKLVNSIRGPGGFPDHAFFALSSFGQPPGTSGELERIRPHRIADPLLWLFWKLGFLRACREDRRPAWMGKT